MAKARFGVVVFPGSNCDHDCMYVLRDVIGARCEYIWHEEPSPGVYDCIVLPGGFSYGDYLRSGAIAARSPVMDAVRRHAAAGGLVVGICNGFQVLTEAGLLPGALTRNASLRFICRWVNVRVTNNRTPFTMLMEEGQVLSMPIAHGEGRYWVDRPTLAAMESRRGVVFTYCDTEGRVTEEANPNGSVANAAGVVNETGNVLGMMPHPERCCEEILGGTDGRLVFESVIRWVEEGRTRPPRAQGL